MNEKLENNVSQNAEQPAPSVDNSAVESKEVVAKEEAAPVSEQVEESAVVEEPVVEEPKAEEPVVEEPVVEEPVVEEPKADEPVVEEPVVEEPKAEEPVAEEPVVEEPIAEEPKAEEPAAEEPVVEEPAAAEDAIDYSSLDKDALVAEMRKLTERAIESIKDEVAQVKAAFYAIRKDEVAAEKAAFLEKGNEEAAFAPMEDAAENTFKELLNVIKEKRAELVAAREAVKRENLDKKKAIIEGINRLTDDPDNINRQYNKLQQLQQEFKAVGEVTATEATEVWKDYQKAVEKFYDLLKMNKELRDYDFKKNLEIKQQLCVEAEELDDEPDVVAAFKKLQDLHTQWRETGPVAKDLREDLWARFKNASSVVNKKYQAFFEERKANEKVNADAKVALCERIEQISTDNLKSYAAWDEVTKQIIALQDEWKKLGFASRRLNNELFTRFRKKCDEFFSQKAEFFKKMKEDLAANLARKNELCEKAEALKDSTDWKATTEALVALQKEWKTIGPVAKKHSDAVWKRFITACDAFFEQKKKQTTGTRAAEHENLKAKKAIIAKLKALFEEETPEDAPQQVRTLMDEWQQVGHVPYKEKDKLYAAYRELIDKAFDELDMRGSRARSTSYERPAREEGGDKMSRERERLVKQYEQKCGELKTYENNMGFFNARSKDGNSIVKEMERKIANLKDEIVALEQKIKTLDEKA